MLHQFVDVERERLIERTRHIRHIDQFSFARSVFMSFFPSTLTADAVRAPTTYGNTRDDIFPIRSIKNGTHKMPPAGRAAPATAPAAKAT